jgi:hypothetical protein
MPVYKMIVLNALPKNRGNQLNDCTITIKSEMIRATDVVVLM